MPTSPSRTACPGPPPHCSTPCTGRDVSLNCIKKVYTYCDLQPLIIRHVNSFGHLQYTKVGEFCLLLMINNLTTCVPTYKYVDDTTSYSVTHVPCDTNLQAVVGTVIQWSSDNDMGINSPNTKDMLISFSRPPPDVHSIHTDGSPLGEIRVGDLTQSEIVK